MSAFASLTGQGSDKTRVPRVALALIGDLIEKFAKFTFPLGDWSEEKKLSK
jgi:hypothetical protein